jgi:hypothetical protein
MTKSRRIDNTMAKRRRIDNTMAKRRRIDNTMVKRRRIDNTMIKRRRIDNTMAKRIRSKRQTTIHYVSTKALTTGRRLQTYLLAICLYNVFSVQKRGISHVD